MEKSNEKGTNQEDEKTKMEVQVERKVQKEINQIDHCIDTESVESERNPVNEKHLENKETEEKEEEKQKKENGEERKEETKSEEEGEEEEEEEENEFSDSDYGEAEMETEEQFFPPSEPKKDETNAKDTKLDNVNNFMNGSKISKSIDPKSFNKFKNDGSFLALAMTMLNNNKRDFQDKMDANIKTKKKKKTSQKKKGDQIYESTKESRTDSTEKYQDHGEGKGKGEQEDEDVKRRKKEFLDTMKNMEEQGFFTERGIGSGLVK